MPYAARLAVIRRDIADLAGQPVSKEFAVMVTSRTTLTSADFYVCGSSRTGLPLAVLLGQVPPRAAGPSPPEHAIDRAAVVDHVDPAQIRAYSSISRKHALGVLGQEVGYRRHGWMILIWVRTAGVV